MDGTDTDSLLVLVLGPVSIGLLIGALVYWLKRRRD
jgi:NhaP-type Na+/H+ or K+/H+ antiporter